MEVGSGVGVIVGSSIVAVGVNVGVNVLVDGGVPVDVAVGVSVGVTVGVSVGVAVGVDVGVAVGVDVGVSVGVAVGVSVGVGVGVSVGVKVGVKVAPSTSCGVFAEPVCKVRLRIASKINRQKPVHERIMNVLRIAQFSLYPITIPRPVYDNHLDIITNASEAGKGLLDSLASMQVLHHMVFEELAILKLEVSHPRNHPRGDHERRSEL